MNNDDIDLKTLHKIEFDIDELTIIIRKLTTQHRNNLLFFVDDHEQKTLIDILINARQSHIDDYHDCKNDYDNMNRLINDDKKFNRLIDDIKRAS